MKALHGHVLPGGQVLRSLVVGSALFLGAPAVLADEPAAPPEPQVAPAASPAAPVLAAAPEAEPSTAAVLPPIRPLTPPAFQIGTPAMTDSAERPYRYPALRIAGIVVTGVGLAGMVTGGILFGFGYKLTRDPTCSECGLAEAVYGFVTFVVGAGVATIGAPLWIVGSVLKKEPPKEPPTIITLVPKEVSLGPGMATLRWTF